MIVIPVYRRSVLQPPKESGLGSTEKLTRCMDVPCHDHVTVSAMNAVALQWDSHIDVQVITNDADSFLFAGPPMLYVTVQLSDKVD